MRIIYLDNMRGVLTLMVVLGHTLLFTNTAGDGEILYRFISAIWMPLFMFISGYASAKSKQTFSMVKRRFGQLIVPFALGSVVLALIQSRNIVSYFLNPTDSFWFLWALFFIIVIHVMCGKLAAALKINENFVVVGAYLLLNVALAFVPSTTMFALNLIVLHFLYYSLGFFARKRGFLISKRGGNWCLCLVVVLWAFVTYFNRGDFVPSFFPLKRHIVYDMVDALIGIYMAMLLFKRFLDKPLGPLSTIGAKWSLEYYVVHLLVYQTVFEIGVDVHYPYAYGVGYYLYVVLVFVLIFILSSLLIKVGARMLQSIKN